jgi:nucleotide-binding universal stress UspA family protein
MKLFHNILVYAEAASSASLGQIVALAEQQNATLSVCDVIESPPDLPGAKDMASRLKALCWQRAFERLRALCKPYMQRLPIDYTILSGQAFVAITEQVIQRDFDLVVHVSDKGPSTEVNATGMHLVRKCPCAVWTMQPGASEQLDSVLLAVDHSLTTPHPQTEQNTTVLALTAASLAENLGAQLHIVHAWLPYAEELEEDAAVDLDGEEWQGFVELQRRSHESWMDTLVARINAASPALTTQSHLRQGPVTRCVPDIARETGASLIVMGTVGTSARPGVLIGTSAEAILTASACPILTIKPKDFRTPLSFSDEILAPASHHQTSDPVGIRT